MRITPLDARKQEFRKAVRGYDCEEVRAFLTTLADEYETVLVDNKQLRERIMEQEDKIGEYKTMERTLRDTLMTAERLMQDTRESAGKEGELIVRDAHMKARQILEECRVRTEELRRELVGLRKEKETYLARFKSLAEAQIQFVDTHRNDFQDLDKRLISMVDAVLEGVGDAAAKPAPAVRPQAKAAPQAAAPKATVPTAAPVWTEPTAAQDLWQDDEPAAAPAAPAPNPVQEEDIWRDYQPLAKARPEAPAPAAAKADHADQAGQAAKPAPQPAPARDAVPEANPWRTGSWTAKPQEPASAAADDQDQEADQAISALSEDAAEPAPAPAVW